MHRFAKAYVLSEADAENIVQDVFVLLWEKKEVLDIRISLTAYLFTLVKNKCLDYLRHQLAVAEYNNELSAKLSALETLNSAFESDEEIEKVITRAIDTLPDRCRDIFVKSRIEGKKHREIADEMNLSVNTIENQIGIALKRLRVELKDYLPLLFLL